MDMLMTQMESMPASNWSELPDDALKYIFSHMQPASLRGIRLVCTAWLKTVSRFIVSLRPESFQGDFPIAQAQFRLLLHSTGLFTDTTLIIGQALAENLSLHQCTPELPASSQRPLIIFFLQLANFVRPTCAALITYILLAEQQPMAENFSCLRPPVSVRFAYINSMHICRHIPGYLQQRCAVW